MGLGVGHIGARAAAEPAARLVVADEGAGMAPAVAVLDPDGIALLEPVLDRVGLLGLVAHGPEPSRWRPSRAARRGDSSRVFARPPRRRRGRAYGLGVASPSPYEASPGP